MKKPSFRWTFFDRLTCKLVFTGFSMSKNPVYAEA